MAEHDYVIDNQSAPAFRADLNNALQAIVSNNSKGTAPTTTYANMLWYDTATNWLFVRNEANSVWIRFAYFDQTTNKVSFVDDTQVVDTSGTQTGLLGDQTTATWQSGTGTTQSLVSPANVKAAVLALAPSSVPTSAQVGSATAGLSANAVGTYATLAYTYNGSTRSLAFGATISGSTLRPVDLQQRAVGSSRSGTWRCMGVIDIDEEPSATGTLFLRIS